MKFFSHHSILINFHFWTSRSAKTPTWNYCCSLHHKWIQLNTRTIDRDLTHLFFFSMSPSLAVLILLVGSIFSSSASILETKKLVLNELSPTKSLIGSPVTSPVKSQTLLATLTGYVAFVTFSDSLCSTPILATFQLLNRCFRSDVNEYRLITATSSTVDIATYTDALCKLDEKAKLSTYTDSVCDGSSKQIIFVSPTTTVPTDMATASAR